MRIAKKAALSRHITSLGLCSLGFCGLLLLTSQLRCAVAEIGWQTDDGSTSDGQSGDGGGGDGGDDFTHCFTGTATSELQLFNHCTEAEHVDRATKIPLKTWDGTSPLPYSQ